MVALKVRCCGNLIIVGDIVRSVIVLRFDTNDVQLVEVSGAEYPSTSLEILEPRYFACSQQVTRDYNTSWICALEILVDGRLIIAEAGGDLLALGRRCSHSDISKGPCLGPLARMRLGDVVTCFASGLLTSRKSTRSATPLFFGCVPCMQGLWMDTQVANLESRIFRSREELAASSLLTFQSIACLSALASLFHHASLLWLAA